MMERMDDRELYSLLTRIEVGQSELRGEVREAIAKLDGKIDRNRAELDKKSVRVGTLEIRTDDLERSRDRQQGQLVSIGVMASVLGALLAMVVPKLIPFLAVAIFL